MTVLPERLRAWAAPLAALHEELAIALAPGVARLAELFSPPRPGRDGDHGELHGYDGLTRRGSPERLLMSEWLLALEVPDEFVRRAALGEQAYLRPAFRRPKPERRCVVLLDAGPEQAGSPRVAHLALLVVLARRAEAAGAHFAWGVLQAPLYGGLMDRVDARSVGPWLRRSHAEPATGARLAAWREHLEAERRAGELWLVGGPRLARLPGAEGLSRVAVDEVLEPGARRLTVEVWPGAGGTRRGELELPEEAHCVRLLRDPFRAEPRARPASAIGPARFLRFSANGLRLLVGHEDGGVSSLMIPNSPLATVARPRRVVPGPGDHVVACGWRYHGGQLVLIRRENTLRLHGSLAGIQHGTFAWTISGTGPRLPEPGQSPLLAWSRPDPWGRETPVIWDAQGDVYALPREPHEPSRQKRPLGRQVFDLSASTLLAGNVLALQEPGGHCFFVGPAPREDSASYGLRVGCLDIEQRLISRWSNAEVHFGPGELQVEKGKGAGRVLRGPSLAVCEPRGARWWLLRDAFRSAEEEGVYLSAPRGRVVGLTRTPGETMELALVVLDEDERTFWWWTARGPRPLTTAPGRVRSACVGQVLPVLVWITEQGEVGMWNFRFEVLVYRSVPGSKR